MSSQTLLNLIAELATPTLIALVAWFVKNHVDRTEKKLDAFDSRMRALEIGLARHESKTEGSLEAIGRELHELKETLL